LRFTPVWSPLDSIKTNSASLSGYLKRTVLTQILWRESCACSLRETLITIWTAGCASPSGFIKDFRSKLLFLTSNSSFIFRDIGISVLCQSSLGTFLVLNSSSLLARGIEHVHEYQLVKENKIGWYIKVKFKTAINEDNFISGLFARFSSSSDAGGALPISPRHPASFTRFCADSRLLKEVFCTFLSFQIETFQSSTVK
jgi:hypothetical protein